MDAQDIADDLDPLFEAAQKEQRDISTGIEQLTKCAKDFINKTFPDEINNLSAAGYQKLEDKISQHTTRLAMDLVSIIHHHTEK